MEVFVNTQKLKVIQTCWTHFLHHKTLEKSVQNHFWEAIVCFFFTSFVGSMLNLYAYNCHWLLISGIASNRLWMTLTGKFVTGKILRSPVKKKKKLLSCFFTICVIFWCLGDDVHLERLHSHWQTQRPDWRHAENTGWGSG